MRTLINTSTGIIALNVQKSLTSIKNKGCAKMYVGITNDLKEGKIVASVFEKNTDRTYSLVQAIDNPAKFRIEVEYHGESNYFGDWMKFRDASNFMMDKIENLKNYKYTGDEE